MAAYEDASAADLLPDNIYNNIFKETDTKQMENYKILLDGIIQSTDNGQIITNIFGQIQQAEM